MQITANHQWLIGLLILGVLMHCLHGLFDVCLVLFSSWGLCSDDLQCDGGKMFYGSVNRFLHQRIPQDELIIDTMHFFSHHHYNWCVSVWSFLITNSFIKLSINLNWLWWHNQSIIVDQLSIQEKFFLFIGTFFHFITIQFALLDCFWIGHQLTLVV